MWCAIRRRLHCVCCIDGYESSSASLFLLSNLIPFALWYIASYYFLAHTHTHSSRFFSGCASESLWENDIYLFRLFRFPCSTPVRSRERERGGAGACSVFMWSIWTCRVRIVYRFGSSFFCTISLVEFAFSNILRLRLCFSQIKLIHIEQERWIARDNENSNRVYGERTMIVANARVSSRWKKMLRFAFRIPVLASIFLLLFSFFRRRLSFLVSHSIDVLQWNEETLCHASVCLSVNVCCLWV